MNKKKTRRWKKSRNLLVVVAERVVNCPPWMERSPTEGRKREGPDPQGVH